VKHIPRIVEKIFQEEARGMILIPSSKDCDWFTATAYMAIDWWDLPPYVPLFENTRENPLSPMLFHAYRVALFDAFTALNIFSLHPNNLGSHYPLDSPLLFFIQNHYSLSPETKVQVSSAIESWVDPLNMKNMKKENI